MSDTLDVRCEPSAGGWMCRVTVTEGGSRSAHDVWVTAGDLARLAPGAGDPVDLVERSFRFLLVREPGESILPRFDLPVIGRYFPEYDQTIRQDAEGQPSR